MKTQFFCHISLLFSRSDISDGCAVEFCDSSGKKQPRLVAILLDDGRVLFFGYPVRNFQDFFYDASFGRAVWHGWTEGRLASVHVERIFQVE